MANDKEKQKKATSEKGTTYTQVNDSTYNWKAPTGYGTIHLDPNSRGPWGTYHVYQASAGPDKEFRLSNQGLQPHLDNISTLNFEVPVSWWIPIKEYVAPRWNRFIDKAKIRKRGGYLTKYALGGATQQTSTDEEEKGLMTLIESAYQEITSGKPGDNFIYVAQLMQDAEAMIKIDALKAKDPSIEDKLNAIEEVAMSNSMYMKKGGCAKKKKVKKGAKGCVPCKKLMKVGGKLVNVLTDCEGNIIHKHQVGGWIRKAEDGMLTQRRNAILNTGHTKDWLTQQEGVTKTGVGKKYYQGADGFMYSIEGTASGWGPAVKLGRYIQSEPGGVYSLADEQGNLVEGGHTIDNNAMIAAADAVNAEKAYTVAGNTQQYYDPTTKKWYNATYNMQTKAWDTTGEATHDNFGDDEDFDLDELDPDGFEMGSAEDFENMLY